MKRRFIAGAVCPDCHAVDRIVMEDTPEGRSRSCVVCDFRERHTGDLPGQPSAGRFEHAGRPTGGPAERTEPTQQIVRIIEPDSDSDPSSR